jgi:hypothetical protein
MNVNVVINDAVNGRVGGALTDFNGNFNICFDSAKGTRISANFILANDSWQVQTFSGNQYRWTTEIHPVTPGVTVNVLSRTTDSTLSRGLHAFDDANDAWQFIPKPTNTCWDQKDGFCRQLKINWAPDSTDGNNYHSDTNDIHLLADTPNVPDGRRARDRTRGHGRRLQRRLPERTALQPASADRLGVVDRLRLGRGLRGLVRARRLPRRLVPLP